MVPLPVTLCIREKQLIIQSFIEEILSYNETGREEPRTECAIVKKDFGNERFSSTTAFKRFSFMKRDISYFSLYKPTYCFITTNTSSKAQRIILGLSPDLLSMEQIRRILRPTDVPDTGLLCDLLWYVCFFRTFCLLMVGVFETKGRILIKTLRVGVKTVLMYHSRSVLISCQKSHVDWVFTLLFAVIRFVDRLLSYTYKPKQFFGLEDLKCI